MLAYSASTKNYSCLNEDCNKCKFKNDTKLIVKILLSEYKKPKLTEDEKVILRNIDDKYNYIARDSNGRVFVYIDKPTKNRGLWGNIDGEYEDLDLFERLFKFIKWEDEEPYEIKYLLED